MNNDQLLDTLKAVHLNEMGIQTVLNLGHAEACVERGYLEPLTGRGRYALTERGRKLV